jgi:drug/metabolite transporter (DMT)-like permease
VPQQTPATHARRNGMLLAAVGTVAFAGKAIIVKLAYRHGVDAVTLVMYRMLFALPLFVLLSWWASRDKPPLTRRDWKMILGLGFSGYYLASALDFAGLQYISASLERLILYLNPTMVLGLGAVLFKKTVQAHQWSALAVSYCGVFIVFGSELGQFGDHVAWGALLVFLSTISYALYLLYSGQEVQRLGALRLTGLASTAACLMCLGQFAILRPWSAALVAPQVIALSVLNATACTFLPVLMVMMAIERLGAAHTAQIGMIGPLATIFMGIIVLDEPFTVSILLGTAAVFCGVWLLARH